jgi:hypothetical protein
MTMATGYYGLTWRKMVENTAAVDLDTDVLKVILVTNTETPNFETFDFYNDVTNEITGTGYTAAGVTLASVTSAISAGTYTFDGADTAWTTSTFTARGMEIQDSSPGSSATNYLIMAVTFGSDFSVSAGTFTIQYNASGIWTAAYR